MPHYALITGASSGIGLALAEALARRGRNLILVARRRQVLESLAHELSRRFGVEVLFRVCDLGEPLQLSGLLHELEQGEWPIDLLVNSAGPANRGAFVAQDWRREQRLIEVNVLALARLCHAIGNVMAGQGSGQILNVAALEAFQAAPWMSNYAASKAYVLHFSEGLREELQEHGVSVSVLCPGPLRSRPLHPAQTPDALPPGGKRAMSAEQVALFTVRALERKRAIIIPGWRNRLLALAPRLAPRWLLRRLSARGNRRLRDCG